MNVEQTPRQQYEESEKKVHIEQTDLETQEERRADRFAEFKKDMQKNPLSSLLRIIDLLPTNLDVALAKLRASSAERKLSGQMNQDHGEALELNQKYDKLRAEAAKATENLKDTLQKLADFETNELGMSDTSLESQETN